jgi:hypothetical protein
VLLIRRAGNRATQATDVIRQEKKEISGTLSLLNSWQSLRGSSLDTQESIIGACLKANASSPQPADLYRSDLL